MSNIDQIEKELQGVGYTTSRIGTPQGEAVVISYKIASGKHAGEKVSLGFSMQGGEGYPEYPPHWVHIHPPYDDGQGGATSEYSTSDTATGEEIKWRALSRPPQDFWDKCSTKNMGVYLEQHIHRFCLYLT